MESLFIRLNLKKKNTLMTGFVVQVTYASVFQQKCLWQIYDQNFVKKTTFIENLNISNKYFAKYFVEYKIEPFFVWAKLILAG